MKYIPNSSRVGSILNMHKQCTTFTKLNKNNKSISSGLEIKKNCLDLPNMYVASSDEYRTRNTEDVEFNPQYGARIESC